MSLEDIGSSVAQQLLCARPSADVHMHNTCCAHVTQLMGGNLITILVVFSIIFAFLFPSSYISPIAYVRFVKSKSRRPLCR